jgi:hypothetical protein
VSPNERGQTPASLLLTVAKSSFIVAAAPASSATRRC